MNKKFILGKHFKLSIQFFKKVGMKAKEFASRLGCAIIACFRLAGDNQILSNFSYHFFSKNAWRNFFSSTIKKFKLLLCHVVNALRRIPLVNKLIDFLVSITKALLRYLKYKFDILYDKTIGVMLVHMRRYEWFNQLEEASQHDVRLTTFVSSFFINVLSLAFPLSIMQVYDRIIPNRSYSTLIILFVAVGFAVILEMVLKIMRSYINLWGDTKYEYSLSKMALNKLMHVPLYVYEKTDIGTRIKQFSILDQMRGFYNNQLLVSLCDIPFLFVFILVIAYIGKWLVFVPLLLSAILLMVTFNYINKWRSFLGDKLLQEAKENDFLVNVLSSIHTAKTLSIENLLMRRYERIQDASDTILFNASVQQGDLSSLKSTTNQVNVVLMGSFGALAVMAGDISTGSLIACILLSGRFMLPLVRLVTAFSRWKMINIIRNQLDTILKIPIPNEDVEFELRGEIKLKDIGYLYKEKSETHWMFQHVNLEIQPCTVVSIVGDSQERKEIFLNILATITRPTTGEYLIDGKGTDEFHSYKLRSDIAYISKIGSLFHGTILDNLSAFNPSLIPVAREYAKNLGLHSILSRLPHGYDTMVGDKAVEALPGGVINMLYIIRALVSKPKIILFDESNMNLDVYSTQRLIELLKKLKSNATIVILSRTKESLDFSDEIYELKNMKLEKVS